MYKLLFLVFTSSILGLLIYYHQKPVEPLSPHIPQPAFAIRSIDTMKYSRDYARDKVGDETFGGVIDQQIRAIADTGATHVAIATPYDSEFVPFLTRWVTSARRAGLKVWFRGNLSGWEEWFGYKSISEEEHTRLVVEFIENQRDLFEDGDIFTPCPECENGGPGDPRATGDVNGFRYFLVRERVAALDAFRNIGRDVSVDVQSMNYDVANLIMDRETTAALGGVVGIDHYVADPAQLVADVWKLAEKSGGKVFLGEFGAPIPDIHGKMSDSEQADWIEKVMQGLKHDRRVAGVNYWVNVGGSTGIWNSDGTAHSAVDIIKHYYTLLE